MSTLPKNLTDISSNTNPNIQNKHIPSESEQANFLSLKNCIILGIFGLLIVASLSLLLTQVSKSSTNPDHITGYLVANMKETVNNIEDALHSAPTAIKVEGSITAGKTTPSEGNVLIPSDTTTTGTYAIPYKIMTTHPGTKVVINGTPEDYNVVYTYVSDTPSTDANTFKIEYNSKDKETIISVRE